MAIATLEFASFLVLAAPIHADDTDDTSTDGIEAPSGEATAPVDTQPPAEPGDPAEDDEGKSK